ncbi:MFS general substrate transporter [Meredithblackwellia eburnea MCA 4105]
MSNAIIEKAELFEVENGTHSSTHEQLDRAVERRVVYKLDRLLCPLFFLIYLVTFIDRANIGNARVAGLEKDLKLVGYQYNISLSIFYIFYALWEIPSNLVCKLLGPKIWIPLQVVAFGLVCMVTAFVHNFGGLVVVRVLLGLAEGGVLPAMGLVLSRFYTRPELVFRVGIMVSAASLAGAFGGLLASGFISIGHLRGLRAPWGNIFFFEGIITIVIGVATYFIMPSEISNAWFLTEEEKEIATARLQTRAQPAPVQVEATKGTLVRRGFTAVPTWLCAFGYLSTNVSVQGVSLFLPTILKALYPGMSTVQVQLRTVPPYIVAFVWTLFLSYMSDRLNRRGIVLLISSPFAIAGYIVFVGTKLTDIHARYAGAFLCILGAFPIGPFTMSWAINNAATDTERGIASGLVPGFGQFGALIATWSYLPHDAPNYKTGNSINVGFTCLTWIIVGTTLAYCTWENRQRAAGKRDHRLKDLPDGEDHTQILGSSHPAFVYST